REVRSVMALTLVITSTLSTYLVLGNQGLARRGVALLERLGWHGRRRGAAFAPDADRALPEVVLLGFHRIASSLLHETKYGSDGRPLLVVDFSPEVYDKLRALNVAVVYGDISHLDTLEHVGVEHARIVLSTVSDDFL